MNKKAIVGLLAIVLSGYCFAAGPAVVSHEQAAAEALENRNLAHDLWLYTFQACIQQDKPALHKIVHKLGQQTFAQPTNHLNYSARFVYEGCKQLLSDVWAFNGMCLSKSASVDEIVRVNNSWENSSKDGLK